MNASSTALSLTRFFLSLQPSSAGRSGLCRYDCDAAFGKAVLCATAFVSTGTRHWPVPSSRPDFAV